MKRLPKAQEQRLLCKHLTGDWGSGQWETIVALRRKRLCESNKRGDMILTDRGKEYCDEFHSQIKSRKGS